MTHSPVITLTGLPGVGKTTVASLLAERLGPSSVVLSEHGSPLVTEVNDWVLDTSNERSHLSLTTSLAYVLYEYELALTVRPCSTTVIVRDRGLEDTRLVIRRATESGAAPRVLGDTLTDAALLHADFLIILEADAPTRRSRTRSRSADDLAFHAAMTFDAEFAETFGRDISLGSRARVVCVDAGGEPTAVADRVHEIIGEALDQGS